MANVSLVNSDGSLLDAAMSRIATESWYPGSGGADPTTVAGFSNYTDYVSITGYGFTYDAASHLTGGTITSLGYSISIKLQGGSREAYTGLALTIAQARQLVTPLGYGRSTLLGGDDVITVNSASANGYGGNDTFVIVGAGTSLYPAAPTVTAIDGGPGVNTAVLPNALRSAATISGGGGTETVVQSGITANMVAIDKLQFIDGAVYEDNASAGAQAVLIFEGLFGRLPDAINAGGYGQLAEQAGTPAAARAMLATAEAQGATASLGNADFVARLYRNMLHREPDRAGAAGWQAGLDSGAVDRPTVAALFASSIEAQVQNFAAFASASVFAADPRAVEVLRAYEVLLGRLPEGAALAGNVARLDGGASSLAQLYQDIQHSGEFAATPNQYGFTAASSYDAVHSFALSDRVTAQITPLVTSGGVAVHA